jgi:hypothetical protein
MLRVVSRANGSTAPARVLRRRRAVLSVDRSGGRGTGVAGALAVAAGYAWRLIVVLAAVYLAFAGLARVIPGQINAFGRG